MTRFTALALLLVVTPTLRAAPDELGRLKEQLLDLLERVEALEQENTRLRDEGKHATAPSATRYWTDTVMINGDLRFRYEHIDIDSNDDRERSRLRARMNVTAKPVDDLELGIGLATGGDSPVSTNQTLGGGASTKDIKLDLAYFKWQALPNMQLVAGKYKNTWYRPGGKGLLWDGDLRPEGLALGYRHGGLFVDGAINFLDSDSRGSEQIAYGIQGGYNISMDNGELLAGIGYFYMGTEGRETFYGDNDEFFGNSFSCANPATLSGCTYDNDFREFEVFAEWNLLAGGRPLSLFVDAVQNQDAEQLDTGWLTGIKYGKASAAGTWEFTYTYQVLEANAVLGLWTDSNVGGGGTDVEGHVVSSAWAPFDGWKLGVTYFDNVRGKDLGGDKDYRRVQIDTSFTF